MKVWTIAFRVSAKQDIQEAVDYYDDLDPKLGDRFIESFQSSISTLTINPFFQVRYDQMRCIPLRTFPYMVHFQVDELLGKITIFAVLHTAKSSDLCPAGQV